MLNKTKTQVPAVDRTAKILKYIAENDGVTYSQIQQYFNIPQSSLSILLNSLVMNGLLRQSNNKYFLGLILYEYGLKSVDQFDIKELAQSALRFLSQKTDLACHLGVLDNKSAIYLAKIESKNLISIKTWLGKRLSLHSSSLGKVLLAWLPNKEIDKIIPDEELPKFTESTIQTKQALLIELSKIKIRGWASEDNEDFNGISCIAAPVFDASGTVIAAISVSGVNFQLKDKETLARYVVEATQILMNEIKNINNL